MKQHAKAFGDALYELALEDGKEDEIFEQVTQLNVIFSENPAFLHLLSNLSLSKMERCQIIDESLGGQVDAYVLNFLKVLCESGVISAFSGCVDRIRERTYQHKGILTAKAVSACAMSEQARERLTNKLAEMTGKTILLETQVDESLIGGIHLEIEGKQFDNTVKQRIATLRTNLLQAIE